MVSYLPKGVNHLFRPVSLRMLNRHHATTVIATRPFDPMVVNPIDVSVSTIAFWECHDSQKFV